MKQFLYLTTILLALFHFSSCSEKETVDQIVVINDTAYYSIDTTNVGNSIVAGWTANMLVDTLNYELSETNNSYNLDLNSDGENDVALTAELRQVEIELGTGEIKTFEQIHFLATSISTELKLSADVRSDSLFLHRTNHTADNNTGDEYYTNSYWSHFPTQFNTLHSIVDSVYLNIKEAFDVISEAPTFMETEGILFVPDTQFSHNFFSPPYWLDVVNIDRDPPLKAFQDSYLAFLIEEGDQRRLGWITFRGVDTTKLKIKEAAIQKFPWE